MELHWRQDEKSYHWEHLLQFHAQFESQVDKMPDQKRNKKNYHCQSQAQDLNLLWWPGGFFGYHYNEFYKEKNNNIETCHLLTFSTTDEIMILFFDILVLITQVHGFQINDWKNN